MRTHSATISAAPTTRSKVRWAMLGVILAMGALSPLIADDEVAPSDSTQEELEPEPARAAWEKSSEHTTLTAPYTASWVGKGRVEVDLGLERDAPPHVTLLGPGTRTWLGELRKVVRRCENACSDDTTEHCYWVGVYVAPGAEQAMLALAGKRHLEDLRQPAFAPAATRKADCVDSTWGAFRTRTCPEHVVLFHEEVRLLDGWTEYNPARIRISHVFRYRGIEFHVAEVSLKMESPTGLLFQGPGGWEFLARGVEPSERVQYCC